MNLSQGLQDAEHFRVLSKRGAEENKQRLDAERMALLDTFLNEFQRRARDAARIGAYQCEMCPLGGGICEFRDEITRALSARGFRIKWDKDDGDDFCVIDWEK